MKGTRDVGLTLFVMQSAQLAYGRWLAAHEISSGLRRMVLNTVRERMAKSFVLMNKVREESILQCVIGSYGWLVRVPCIDGGLGIRWRKSQTDAPPG